MGNQIGKLFKVTNFGESHGEGIGVVIDGVPSGIKIDEQFIQNELQRRKPGQSKITTQRKEEDHAQILSGVFEGYSTGTPIAIFIKNENQRSNDYSHISNKFRPSHADYTYHEKYGLRDYRGGGRSSARETASRVAAGAIAKLFLKQVANIEFFAYTSQVGNLKLETYYKELNFENIEKNAVRCPDENLAQKMYDLIETTRKNQDTIGGVVTGIIKNVPVGLGEPVFDKLHARLGSAMLSINAVKGFEYGSGFEGVKMNGSQHNDIFYSEKGKVKTQTNHSGGIQGGISNGEDIYFNVAFKPVATIMQDQESIDTNYQTTTVSGKGRHDPCVVPRAVPIVEAMAAITIADFFLLKRTNKVHF